jgi:DNA-binding SARP family transcriptional activator
VVPVPAPVVRLLGRPFTLSLNGPSLAALRTRKGVSLFALLALRRGESLPRDYIASLLWPESDHEAALANLRNSLTSMRHALGAEACRLLSPTPRTLALDLRDVELDVHRFDAAIRRGDPDSLAGAVAIYRGPLLQGRYDLWVAPEREPRAQAFLTALETLAADALGRGDANAAEESLRRAIAGDPLRERARRELMRLLAARGHLAAALLLYRELQEHLHRELNVVPDPETRDLYEQLRRQSPPTVKAKTLSPAPVPLPKERATDNGGEPGLPQSLTRFVGREAEIAGVCDLLERHPLVTLTGVGGCGKTRLALQCARPMASALPDGVCLVELASLGDPALVPQTVAAALGIREEPGRPMVTTLVAALRSRRLLLLLDNCEHLLDACARLAEALTEGCPGLRVLATSREALGAAGEQSFPVPPLSLPPEAAPGGGRAALLASETVQLFLDRAEAVLPTFALTEANAPSVREVCRKLDGLPLAIELAASQLRLLPVDEIAARLGHRFQLLADRHGVALPRHRSLAAAVDGS